ncbi:MAG TPA: PDZ domain-containing protein [Pirellulaceae bacterium]|nr:PDZ domain-containing protein [Pirellulaceae bacterium]
MRLTRILAAAALVLLVTNLGLAQSLLDKVESQLKGVIGGAAGAAAPADAAAEKPYLGFVPNEEIKDGKGVLIVSVTPGGPAELGGLKGGDRITAVDGKAVTNLDQFDAIYNTAVVGQKLRMTVDRAGKLQSLTVTLAARPARAEEPGEAPAEPALTDPTPRPALTDPSPRRAPLDPLLPSADPAAPAAPAPLSPIRSKPLEATPAEPAPLDLGTPPATPEPPVPGVTDDPLPAETSGRPSLGITVVPLTAEARVAYSLPVTRGALIANVRPGSPADTAGLPVGGTIVAIDGRKIDSADELVAAIRAYRPGQEVEIRYYDGPQLATKTVRLAPAAAGIVAAPGATPPGVGPGAADAPLGLRLGGTDRPLLSRVERAVEGFTNPRGASTVYDPAEMAALRDQVLSLEEEIKSLTERVKLLEAKLSNSAPAANPQP